MENGPERGALEKMVEKGNQLEALISREGFVFDFFANLMVEIDLEPLDVAVAHLHLGVRGVVLVPTAEHDATIRFQNHLEAQAAIEKAFHQISVQLVLLKMHWRLMICQSFEGAVHQWHGAENACLLHAACILLSQELQFDLPSRFEERGKFETILCDASLQGPSQCSTILWGCQVHHEPSDFAVLRPATWDHREDHHLFLTRVPLHSQQHRIPALDA
mmetsp:Transcript_56576/g.123726  ORF Transcript_56576/g.123726 Transcript_56576/m.123726 type:complete len:218 (-) Transcript_56576:565-1218(-)